MAGKYTNVSAADFLKQKSSHSSPPSSSASSTSTSSPSPAPVSSSTRSSTKNPYAGVSASDFLASKSSASSPLSNPLLNSGSGLESNLRVTPDKWNAVNGGYEAYENNRNSPDFVYDENVNRNQYNSVKSLMDDIDADIAFYRQQGNNIDADGLLYNKDQLQEILNALDKEYNDNKAPEAEKEGANNSESLGFWDTLRNIFSGGFKGTIGNTVEGQRNLYALGQGARDAETNEQIERWTREVERAQRAIEEDIAAYGADSETVQGDRAILENAQRMLDAYNVVPEAQRGAVEETAKLSDEIAASSYEDIQAAKEGKGKVGQIAVDVGTNAVQMAGDVLLGKLLGTGNGMLPMAARSYGGAVQEARQAGATEQEQAAYGLTKAGIEMMTEKIADGLAGAYGKGTADDIIESVIGKMSSNNTARNALRLGFSALGEGSEELASDLLDPVAKAIYDKGEALKTKYTDPEAWKEAVAQEAYDMLIGSIMGFGGGTVSMATGEYARNNAELDKASQAAQETATSQNSPTEQTSVSEPSSPLSETVLNATEAQQTASAPTVSENTENPQGPRPFDMGAVARDVWNQQTQQAQEQTATNAVDQAETQQTTAQEQTPFTSNTSEEGNGPQVESGLSENISTDSARDEQIQQMFEEDPQFYRQKTNADTLKNAKAMLGENFDVDPTEAVGKVRAALDNAKNGMKLKPETVPATKLVADKLAEQARALEAEGKTAEAQAKMQTARGLLADLASELTQAGQLGQAARILRNQGPAVRAQYITNLLDEFNNSLTKRQSKKISKRQTEAGQKATGRVEVPQELLNAFRDADTAEAQETALHDIAVYVGENTPSTLYQKWTNLRFTNMLGNFVTQIRNVLGNSTSSLNHMVKRRINGNIENAVKNVDRSFAGRYGTSELASWWNAFKSDPQIENAAMNGGRYDTVRKLNKGAFGQDVESNQTVYGGRDPASRYLEAKRKATNWATEQGDVIFQRLNFADAAAGYAKAHGFTFETATDAQKADAVEYAIKEAQEATFHNDTALSDLVTGLHIKENSQFAKAHPLTAKVVNAFGDGLLPFRKTPANILTQAEEFSPLGLINTAVKATQAQKGNATASDVINSFSKAMTGTGVMGLGMMMRALGKARASDDDEERSDYAKLNGEQDYAVKVGGHWLTADWVAPDSIPFFMGVKFMDILAERDGFQTDDITQFLGGMTDTFLNMSMLQGLNDTLENLNGFGTDADAMPKLATSLAISYLTQGLGSSLAGRIESAFTENRQDTYTDPDSPLSKDLQYAIGRLGNKILGADFQQADYIDAWGNKQKGQGVDNPLVRAALAMFSPSYVREDTTTDFDRGLMELHDQLEGTDFKGDVLPAHISRSTVIGDKRLTPEEYEIYATNVGQMRREMAEAFWNSSLRETLSPEEQGKVITDIYEYCASRGKADILERRGESLSANDDWADDIEFFGDDANRLTKYLATKDAFNDNLNNGDYEAIDALLKTIDSFTDNDGKFANKDTQYYVDNIQGLEKYVLAAKQGVTSDMLTEAKDAYNRLNKQKGLSKSEMTTRFTSWVDNNVQTADWTDKQKDAVKSLLKYYNQVPVNTDRYERMGEYGVDSRTITAIESDIENLKASAGYEDLNDTQKKYRQYEAVLKRAATLSDDQALAVIKAYGSLRPGGKQLKWMIQNYFGDKDLDFQIEMYNAVRDEMGSKHDWNSTRAVAP